MHAVASDQHTRRSRSPAWPPSASARRLPPAPATRGRAWFRAVTEAN